MDRAVGVAPSLKSLMALNASTQQSANTTGLFSGALSGIAGAVGAGLGSGVSAVLSSVPSGINAHAMWEDKIKQLEADIKKAEETMQSPSQIAYMKAELNAKKQSYVQTQIDVYKEQEKTAKKYSGVADPVGVQGAATSYYSKMFLNNLKSQVGGAYSPSYSIPAKKEEPVFDSVSMVQAEQKFIQRVGMASNCNVSVQSKVFGTYPKRTAYRTICDQCQASEPLNDGTVVTHQRHNDPVLLKFCTAHRHETEAPACVVSEGRKFRDE